MTINLCAHRNDSGPRTRGAAHCLSLLAGALAFALPALTAVSSKAETVLKFAVTVPLENATATQVFKPWADKVNEEAKGEFRIQVYGLELANSRNVWERTLSGVADIGWALHGTVGLPFPKTSVITLPLLVEDKQAGAASTALWQLYQSGMLSDEYKGVKVLGLVALPVQGLATKSKVAKFEDLKGQKISVRRQIVRRYRNRTWRLADLVVGHRGVSGAEPRGGRFRHCKLDHDGRLPAHRSDQRLYHRRTTRLSVRLYRHEHKVV